jgi:HEAT repeat protein
MARSLLNTKKIQNGTRKLALLLSDSTFITVQKLRHAAKMVFGSDDAKQKHEFLEQLAALLQSESPTVRLAVVEALERASRDQSQMAEAVRSTLETALKDEDTGVRQAAEMALKRGK